MRLDGIPDVPVSHAMIDGDGRLVAADPALLALNEAAGGTMGAALAVPQLATVARLARRLGILVSRGVVVADGDTDLDLWIRAQPDGDGVRMAVSGWREMRARPVVASPAARLVESDYLAWDTDGGLRLTFVSIDAARRLGLDALSLLGALRTAMNAFRAAGSRAGGDAGREAGKSDTGSGRSSGEEPRAAGDDDDNLFVG